MTRSDVEQSSGARRLETDERRAMAGDAHPPASLVAQHHQRLVPSMGTFGDVAAHRRARGPRVERSKQAIPAQPVWPKASVALRTSSR